MQHRKYELEIETLISALNNQRNNRWIHFIFNDKKSYVDQFLDSRREKFKLNLRSFIGINCIDLSLNSAEFNSKSQFE